MVMPEPRARYIERPAVRRDERSEPDCCRYRNRNHGRDASAPPILPALMCRRPMARKHS